MQYKDILHSLAFEVNDLLNYYIQVHNDALKKAGTLSSLFRRVNFEKLYNDTLELSESFSTLLDKLKFFELKNYRYMDEEQKEYLRCLLRFMKKLGDTIELLKQRQTFLYDKSKCKEDKDYKYRDYTQIEKLYQNSIKDYLEVGKELNDLKHIISD